MTYHPLKECPVCTGEDIQFLLTGIDRLHRVPGEWPLWRCSHCRAGFLNPMPSADIIGQFYPNDYYAYSPPSLPKEPPGGIKRIAWLWRNNRLQAHLSQIGYHTKPQPLYKLMVKLFPVSSSFPRYIPNGHFLDIGCGAGQYLLEMQSIGWKTTGVELNPAACRAARQAGLNVHQGHLEEARFADATFDIVRMADVLEHVPDPHQTLDEIYRILKPNGQIEITLPNLDAWTFKVFQQYWFPLEIPRHLYHHTPKSLEILAAQHGLSVKELHVWSHKEVDVTPSLQWLLQERSPLLHTILNFRPIWKIIRKCFALPKAVACYHKQGSAMTVTLIKNKDSV